MHGSVSKWPLARCPISLLGPLIMQSVAFLKMKKKHQITSILWLNPSTSSSTASIKSSPAGHREAIMGDAGGWSVLVLWRDLGL